MLTFDEATHEYKIDGVVCPSVTQIISHYMNPYAGVPAELLRQAADFGRAVHKMCALHLSGTLDTEVLNPKLVPYLNGFQKFSDKYIAGDKLIKVEQPLCSKRLFFAGTPDIVTCCQVFDLKTRPYKHSSDALQLASYDKLVGGTGNSIEHYVVEILPDDYSLTRCNDRNAWPMFKAMLDHYHATQKIENQIQLWKGRI